MVGLTNSGVSCFEVVPGRYVPGNSDKLRLRHPYTEGKRRGPIIGITKPRIVDNYDSWEAYGYKSTTQADCNHSQGNIPQGILRRADF